MKGDWNWKKFLALFMAVTMVMASGVFVTTQSFKATDDEYYEADESEDMESVDADEEDYEEEEVEIGEEDFEDEEDLDEEDADEETADAEDGGESEDLEETEEAENAEELQTADVKSVKVRFDLNGGEGNETPDEQDAEVSGEGGLDIDLPDLEDYTDGNGATHIFLGWSTDASATEPEDNISADGDEVELYAIWELAEAEQPETAEQTDEQKAAEEAAKAAEAEKAAQEAAAAEEAAQAENAEVTADAEEEQTEEAEAETAEDAAEEQTEEAAENAEALEGEQQLTEEELAAQQLEQLFATYVAGDAFGTSGDVSVSASWDTGVFPKGTTMEVEEISSEEALEMLGDAAGDATGAVAVDITFIGPDGTEVQPYNNAPVNISLSFGTPVFGEDQTLYHVDESGSVNAVGSADVSETGVDFEADGFSPFIMPIKSGDTHSYANREEPLSYEAYQDITLVENWTQTVDGKEVTVGGEWEIDEPGKEILNFFEGEDTHPAGGTDPETEPVSVRLQTTGKAGDAVVTFKYTVGGNDYVDTFKIHIKGYTIHFDANGANGQIPDQTVTMTAGGYALVQMPGQGELSKSGYNFKGWGRVSDLLAKDRRYGWAYFTGDKVSKESLYPADDGNEATTSDTYRINANDNQEEYTFYAQWAAQSGGKDKIGFFLRNSNVVQTEPADYPTSEYTNVFGKKMATYRLMMYQSISVNCLSRQMQHRQMHGLVRMQKRY